jgi:hypothetical protein
LTNKVIFALLITTGGIMRKIVFLILLMLPQFLFRASCETIVYDQTPQGWKKGIYTAPDPSKSWNVSGSVTSEGTATETTLKLIEERLQRIEDNLENETLVSTFYEVTLADTTLWETFIVPECSVQIEFNARQNVDVLWSKTGITYKTLKAGAYYYTPDQKSIIDDPHYLFKDPVNVGTVVEITVWRRS